MRRIGVFLAVLAALTAGRASSASAQPSVPVVRCPTLFGISGEARVPPRTISVLGTSLSARGLVAYTNTEDFLVGPAGMTCSGIVAVDGGSEIAVWASGRPKPPLHARYAALTLSVDPACASCRAEDACPFFPELAASLGFPCNASIPAGERVYKLRPTISLFEDPPGVDGDGWPSGGPDPANGLVGVNTSSPMMPLVYRSTCTLPASQHAVCTASLNEVIARLG